MDTKYRDNQDRPVGNWSRHARQRKLWLCKLRACISMAGARDRMMWWNLSSGSKILDVGCGGGRPILADIGPTVGLEPIPALAAQARMIYSEVIECNAEKMLLPDNQFDAVVSTDILGHIPVPIKDAVMAEMFRVLRPGGTTLHLGEADSDGWLARIAKREPQPYQRVWVDEPDHRAMEPAAVQLDRFRKAGFIIEKARPFHPVVPGIGGVAGLLKEHKKLPLWLKCYRFVDGLLAKNEVVCEIANILFTPLSIFNLFSPAGSGMGIIIKARKPHDGEIVTPMFASAKPAAKQLVSTDNSGIRN